MKIFISFPEIKEPEISALLVFVCRLFVLIACSEDYFTYPYQLPCETGI